MQIKNENIEIRGRGKKTRFYVDNEILEVYGPILKPHGIALYVTLAKFANSKTQVCFPSYETLMECSGIGRRNTVTKKLNLLKELGLIRILHSKGKGPNYYKLLHVGPKENSSSRNAQQPYLYKYLNSSERDTRNQSIKSKKEINSFPEREDTNTNTKAESISDILQRKQVMMLKQKSSPVLEKND